MADVRIIAVCKGGPLDGQHFSVLADAEGSPEPLTSRAAVVGVLYRPVSQIDLTEELHERFYGDLRTAGQESDLATADLDAHKAVFGHVAAWEYVPEGGS